MGRSASSRTARGTASRQKIPYATTGTATPVYIRCVIEIAVTNRYPAIRGSASSSALPSRPSTPTNLTPRAAVFLPSPGASREPLVWFGSVETMQGNLDV
jgi:hypothetical protein